MYFQEYNLFPHNKPGIDFDNFKKNFFPHLYLVQETADDQEDKEARDNRNEIKRNGEKQTEVIVERLKRLE